jgi:hypothetical protein
VEVDYYQVAKLVVLIDLSSLRHWGYLSHAPSSATQPLSHHHRLGFVGPLFASVQPETEAKIPVKIHQDSHPNPLYFVGIRLRLAAQNQLIVKILP